MILEYANRLSLDGIKVTMLYSSALFFNEASWALKTRMIIRYLYNRLTGSFTCNRWFRKESAVDEKWVWSLEQSYAPIADCYIATSVETASFWIRIRSILIKNIISYRALRIGFPGLMQKVYFLHIIMICKRL